MINMIEIAEKSDMIINGYAFSRIPAGIQAVNLERSTACVFGEDDTVIESRMDDIELEIVTGYYKRIKKFMEE